MTATKIICKLYAGFEERALRSLNPDAYRMLLYKSVFFLLFCSTVIGCSQPELAEDTPGSVYYVSTSGSDDNDGTIDAPWKTLSRLNAIDFNRGDTVYLTGGQAFHGTLTLDSSDSGAPDHPVVITSRGDTKASIDAGNSSAIIISFAKNINVLNLHLKGSGRKEGNTQSGLVIRNSSRAIHADHLDIEGFQKSGLLVYACSDLLIENVHAHDNGGAGILVSGNNRKSDNKNIVIRHCRAENNPGDPTELDNHSGNGILVGMSTNVVVEYCVATNNGWDMPRTGNGPVGIWTYESDSVVIQHCISYRNKTSKGGEDGGGFDFDGGVTNSIIQYCLSYENEGSGFGIFQYHGASVWKNNTVRFNISENDGLVSRAHSGLFIWNGSDRASDFTDFYFYNNTVYNTEGHAIYFDERSAHRDFYYYNNIFVAKDKLIKGLSMNDSFAGNNWWSLSHGFNMDGEKDFNAWVSQSGQEKLHGTVRGLNVDPGFDNLAASAVTDPAALSSFIKYKLDPASTLRTHGIDLKAGLGINTGGKDFNQNPIPLKGIGASF